MTERDGASPAPAEASLPAEGSASREVAALDVAGLGARARGGPALAWSRARASISDVTFQAGAGVLGILGSQRDGTSLLFDVVDGTTRPTTGRVLVFGESPTSRTGATRARVWRVSFDAPLPDGLTVEEVCALASELRSEPSARREASPHAPAKERLAVLGAAHLARRRADDLSLVERRTVSLALALTSTGPAVLLLEEPLLGLDPVAPRHVPAAIRARAETACVLVTTASPREAVELADQLAVLTSGAYAAIDPGRPYATLPGEPGRAQTRIVLASSRREAAGALLAALAGDANIFAIEHAEETGGYRGAKPPEDEARGARGVVTVTGESPGSVAIAVTRALARAGVDVDVASIEPVAPPLDALRAALARAAARPEESAPAPEASEPAPERGEPTQPIDEGGPR